MGPERRFLSIQSLGINELWNDNFHWSTKGEDTMQLKTENEGARSIDLHSPYLGAGPCRPIGVEQEIDQLLIAWEHIERQTSLFLDEWMKRMKLEQKDVPIHMLVGKGWQWSTREHEEIGWLMCASCMNRLAKNGFFTSFRCPLPTIDRFRVLYNRHTWFANPLG